MAEPLKKPDLYEEDFYAWTQDQAAKLRARAAFDNRGDIDWQNTAEEIESVGASEKREIRSRLRVIALHLLKWRYEPEKRKSGWRSTIDTQRERMAMVIEDSPSLRGFPSCALESAYGLARIKAADETGLPESVFPASCPFKIKQILDSDFFPEAA
ncbi:DUF29 domain-containing protein [Aureimonas psammosilenae]|uniref:DUF29 domain-containing protein n=1 Tax=Aureimonas psammosilenae TaxID=2495496 RepID=UPI0012609596|nr:DUF29 domain-containing protein [Aureimonas psammosilenae]